MDLSDAIQRLKPKAFEGRVHRIYDPEHGFLETIGSYISGGRWNRRNEYGALYTSLSKATAIAEICRMAEKRVRKRGLKSNGTKTYAKLSQHRYHAD